MRSPAAALALGVVGLLTAVVYGAQPGSVPDADGYVGSNACQRCHEPEYDTWRRSLHVQMTKPIAEARVLGDFRPGTRVSDPARAYTMDTRDGRYFISISRGGRTAERFEIHYTLGARRFQGYLSRLPDGRIYVLPIFWHNETGRWIDYREITPIPDDPAHDLRQIWNVSCVNCHATNLVRNFDAATNTFNTTWTEMGIGCEACHGPGRAHIDDPDHLKVFTMKKVAPREVFDACGYCHGNKTNVFFGFKPGDRYEDYALPFLISEPIPDNDPQGDFWPDGRPSRFNRPQALTLTGCFQKGEATCTSCHRMHGTQNNHALKVSIDAPDGGHSRESDTLCTQCHSTAEPAALRLARLAPFDSAQGARSEIRSAQDIRLVRERGPAMSDGREAAESNGPAMSDGREAAESNGNGETAFGKEHTHHDSRSQGSRCINCHMSDVNWRLFTRRLDHTFQPPVPELTARYGVPNACTTCHEDKSPEWAAATMDEWYGNGERRQAVVALADTIYRAGTGDTAVLGNVASLAVNKSHGSLIRASAAEFAGQLIARINEAGKAGKAGDASVAGHSLSPAIVNALIGAANDPEPVVRITAVRALSLVDDPRVAPVLAAHLIDSARVVRVSAAEALMNRGVAAIDGPAGQALSNAQDEWAASLRTFGDIASDHTTLGWLEAARGRGDEAVTELQLATRLDPADARPHVYLGVLAARQGRFEAALQSFRTAKALAPGYQNLDRLIAEAEKRITKNH